MSLSHARHGGALLLALLLALTGLLVGAPTSATTEAAAPTGLPDLALVEIATGFNQPTDIANARDARLFITEKPGLIRIIAADGTVLPTPFLDIRSQVCDQSEGGLLGLVFHPDYETNGFFFVNYTTQRGSDCDTMTTHIARFSVSADPNVADVASERIILSVDQPYDNHNAGDLAFGPDGYLYIPLGDGGSGGDPENRSQDGTTLLGKLLRIAPSTSTGTEPDYTIPSDNPYVSNPSVLDEIWAFGLRNPWRISFDRLTGDLWISDVGQGSREEVNFQPATSNGGENYGWRCFEGTLPYNTLGCGSQKSYDGPAVEYGHNLGNTVTGGFVYRGGQYPGMYGHYIFADFGSGRFWSVTRDGAGAWQLAQLHQFPWSFVTFGEGPASELYVATYGFGDGTIYEVMDLSSPKMPERVFLPLAARE